jgi:hypothetical protein
LAGTKAVRNLKFSKAFQLGGKMILVMVGSGAAQAVLNLDSVPSIGEVIAVKSDQVVWSQCGAAFLMTKGKTYRIVGQIGTAVYAMQSLPWFDISEVQ